MNNWHSIEVEDIYKITGSSDSGLSNNLVKEKILKCGKNVLPKEKRDGFFKLFFSQLISPIVLVMMFAGVCSFFAGEIVDFIAIIFIILVDLIFQI